MARIKARIKPRPMVAQSRSDAKLKRAEARALAAEAEEREFARKEAAEDDALLATQEEKMARKAEEKRRVTKELVDQHFKNKSDRKAREKKINDEHMRAGEKKLEKLFEDQKEEARVQKAVDDAAEKDAVDSLSALTAAVDAPISAFTAAVFDLAAVDAHLSALTAGVDALRTSNEEQARNRQEAASKKESENKHAADALHRASLEWAEKHDKNCAEEDASGAALFVAELKLKELQEGYFSDSD